MQLSAEDLQAIHRGQAVPVTLGGTKCVVVRADVFGQASGILTADETYELIERVMAEDDADDPALESYQRYK